MGHVKKLPKKAKPNSKEALIARFIDIYRKLTNDIEEDSVCDTTMLIIRNKTNTIQVQLKVTKDDFDFIEKGHGELIAEEMYDQL